MFFIRKWRRAPENMQHRRAVPRANKNVWPSRVSLVTSALRCHVNRSCSIFIRCCARSAGMLVLLAPPVVLHKVKDYGTALWVKLPVGSV